MKMTRCSIGRPESRVWVMRQISDLQFRFAWRFRTKLASSCRRSHSCKPLTRPSHPAATALNSWRWIPLAVRRRKAAFN